MCPLPGPVLRGQVCPAGVWERTDGRLERCRGRRVFGGYRRTVTGVPLGAGRARVMMRPTSADACTNRRTVVSETFTECRRPKLLEFRAGSGAVWWESARPRAELYSVPCAEDGRPCPLHLDRPSFARGVRARTMRAVRRARGRTPRPSRSAGTSPRVSARRLAPRLSRRRQRRRPGPRRSRR